MLKSGCRLVVGYFDWTNLPARSASSARTNSRTPPIERPGSVPPASSAETMDSISGFQCALRYLGLNPVQERADHH